jgi:hypothetical protein
MDSNKDKPNTGAAPTTGTSSTPAPTVTPTTPQPDMAAAQAARAYALAEASARVRAEGDTAKADKLQVAAEAAAKESATASKEVAARQADAESGKLVNNVVAQSRQDETDRKSIAFTEQQFGPHPAYFVSVRVFIAGVEVTNWLTGTVTLTYAGRDGHNTASFTLQSALDNFIITNLNAPGLMVTERATGEVKETEANLQIYRDAVKRAAELETQISIAKATGDTATVQRLADEYTAAVAAEASSRFNPMGAKITQDDVINQGGRKGQWRDGGAEMPLYSELAKHTIYNYKNNRTLNPVLDIDGEQLGRTSRANTSGSRMWPLQAQRPIFHKNDPVRIFIHNPFYHPRDASDEQWLPAFAGFIEGYPWSDDYLSGHTDVQISCYDLRALMRYMRVVNILPQENIVGSQTKAGAELNLLKKYFGQGAATGSSGFTNSMFTLMLLNSGTKNMLAGKRFETLVVNLTVGDVTDAAGNPAPTSYGTSLEAAGGGKLTPVGPLFKLGKIQLYGGTDDANLEGIKGVATASSSPTALDDWHTLCLCGPRDISRYGVTTKRVDDRYLTSPQVEQLGKNTVWWYVDAAGTIQPGKACPVNQELHLLLPGKGTVFRTLFPQENAGNTMAGTELDYTDRFTLLNEICNIMDYQWYVTPFGDLAFEFPMYDFFPTPGLRVQGSKRSTQAGSSATSQAPANKAHMGFQKWAGAFTLDWHLTSSSFNEESGELTTILFTDGALNEYGTEDASNPTNKSLLFIPAMLRRLGGVTASVNFPYLTDKRAICFAGLLEFRRRIARYATMEVSAIYRPLWLPNRPIFAVPRQRCGTTASITHTLEINGAAGTTVSLQYMRQRDEFGNWTHVTGAENMPLDYTLMESNYPNWQNRQDLDYLIDGICMPCLSESGGGFPDSPPAASGPRGTGRKWSNQSQQTGVKFYKYGPDGKPVLQNGGTAPRISNDELGDLLNCLRANNPNIKIPTGMLVAVAARESNGFYTVTTGVGQNATGTWQQIDGYKGLSLDGRIDPVTSSAASMSDLNSAYNRIVAAGVTDPAQQLELLYEMHALPAAGQAGLNAARQNSRSNLPNSDPTNWNSVQTAMTGAWSDYKEKKQTRTDAASHVRDIGNYSKEAAGTVTDPTYSRPVSPERCAELTNSQTWKTRATDAPAETPTAAPTT